MSPDDDIDADLRAVAQRNAASILAARRRAETALESRTQELARSLAAMKATLEATTDAILVTNSQRRVTAVNDRYARMWGLDPETIIGADHLLLIRSNAELFADPQAFVERIQSIYTSADSEIFDELRLKDGRLIERYSRIQRVDGRDEGRVWSLRDITAQRRTEEALHDEARNLDKLNRIGSVLAASLELPEVLQAVTDAATEISGAAFGALFYNTSDDDGDALALYTLSGAPREAFANFPTPRATPLFGPTFHGEGPIRCDDVMADPRYGQWPPHRGMPPGHLPVRSYLAVAVKSRTGEVLGGLFFGHPEPGVFTERTERTVAGIAAQASIAIDNARIYGEARRLAEQRERLGDAERAARAQSERMSHMKDEFLATLSHELRTPLTAILGWARVLLRKGDDGESRRQGLEAIERNARAQAQLIDDLLDMNRIVSGKVRLDVQPTDPSTVINAAIDAVRPSADSREVRLSTILDPRAGPVSGDPARLQQVLWNLLSNAVKFTPKGGGVTVSLARVDSHLEIVVRDSGIGIAPEFLPQVFDRFRQADSSSTRTHGGLGLGLSIVKQLVELHGGSVRADSAGLGHGSVFTVVLPLAPVRVGIAREDPAPAQPADPAFGNLSLAGVTALVVDDEQDARDLICHVLREHQVRVVGAASAAQGLALIESLRPDVIVSDIGMPNVDGFEFIKEVRALPPSRGGRTPAIALTAFARSEDRTRAMLAGFQLHIAKPIEPYELAASIGSLVGRGLL